MTQVAVADVGGTHARFALAEVENGKVVSLGEPVTLKTAEHGSFQLAWQEFGRRAERCLLALPRCFHARGIFLFIIVSGRSRISTRTPTPKPQGISLPVVPRSQQCCARCVS